MSEDSLGSLVIMVVDVGAKAVIVIQDYPPFINLWVLMVE